jgi:RimJ/RimL family protein N-acetyltransferase
LYLRPLTAADATQTYADWLNDPEIGQYLETRHVEQTTHSCRDFIAQCNADPNSHLFGVFLNDDRHIGNAKIGFINPRYKTGQLSLFIGDKSQWGQGIAGEVVAALTRYGFHDLGLERIEAGCYEPNQASLKVFLNAGYSHEGTFRNHVEHQGHRVDVLWLAILKSELPA